MLGVAQQLEIRLGLRLEADAPRGGEALERGARALLAEIARDGRGQFLDRHRRAPQPKLGAIGVRSDGTNRSACSRSIEVGARRSENADIGERY